MTDSESAPESATNARLELPAWKKPFGVLSKRMDAGDRRQRARQLLIGFVIVAMALVAADLFLKHELDSRESADAAGQEAMSSAMKLVPEVLGYSYKTLDDDLARGLAATTGAFHEDLSKLHATMIIPAAKEQKITTKAAVTGASVSASDDEKVHLLLFVTQSTSAGTSEPRVDGSRIKVTLDPVDDGWRISELTPV